MLRATALLVIAAFSCGCVSTAAAAPTPPASPAVDSSSPAPGSATPSPVDGGSSTASPEPPAAPASATIRIANFAFDPDTATIQAGGTVTWTNADGDRHSILIDGLESDRLESGSTFSHAFATAGTYAYACGIHASMRGTVVVLGSGSDPDVAAPAEPVPAPTSSPDDRDEDRDDDHSGHGRGGDDDDEDHSGRGGGGSGHG